MMMSLWSKTASVACTSVRPTPSRNAAAASLIGEANDRTDVFPRRALIR